MTAARIPAPVDVFISYNSHDVKAVEQIARMLERAGVATFVDQWHLIPGEPWQEALERALDGSMACAVMVGAHGLGPWQNEEVRTAIEDQVRRRDYRVIPVFLPGVEPSVDILPRFLRRFTACQLRSLDEDDVIRRLVAGIRGRQPGPAAVPVDTTARPTRSVSRHIRTELGVERFTWRRAGVLDAVRHSSARAPRPVVLHGLAGMGKTVVACHLVEELFDDGREALVIPITQPSAAASAIFVERVADFLATHGQPAYRPHLARRPLPELLRSMLDDLSDLRLLVVLDGAALTDGSWETLVCDRLAAAPDITLLVTSPRRPELSTQVHAVPVPPLSQTEAMEFIVHYCDLLGLTLDPATVAARLGPAFLSSPIALRAYLRLAQSTPTSLLAPDTSSPLRLITRLVKDLGADERRALAFADIVTGAPLDLVRQTSIQLPHNFERSVHTLVDHCLLHTKGDTLDVPALVVEILNRTFPQDRAEMAANVSAALIVSSRDDTCPVDALAIVYASIAARWAAGGDWQRVEEICQEPLLERFNLHARWKEYLLLLLLRVDAADHVGSTEERIGLRFRLVRKLAQTGDLPAAWDTLRAVQEIIALHAPQRQAELLSHRGFLNHLERNESAALEDFHASLDLHEASGNPVGMAIVKKLLGNLHLSQHRYRPADRMYRDALTYIGDSEVKQRLEIEASLAMCELHLASPATAEQRLRRIVAEMRSWGFRSEMARVMVNLTAVLEKQGRYAEARQAAADGARLAIPDTPVARVLDAMADRLSRSNTERTG